MTFFSRKSMILALLVQGVASVVWAVPSSSELAGGALRIVGDDYQVELSAAGAIRVVSGAAGEVYRSASGAAWVLRTGADGWASAGQFPVQRSVVADGDFLVVQFDYLGSLAGRSYAAQTVYRFAPAAEFTVGGWLQNDAGPAVELIAFPGPMVLDGVPLKEIVFPFQRGIVARPPAVGQGLSTTVPAGFTDFVWVESEAGSLAISEPVTDPMPGNESKLIAIYRSADAGNPLGWHLDRTLELAQGARWTKPATLFQVNRSAVAAARRHWAAGATGSYPTLRAKLGADLFDRLSRSVLFKYPDGPKLPFASSALADRLAVLPVPSLLHIPSYMPGGHDSSYPDYLPPDPALGSTAEFGALIQGLRARGILVNPYTNPTFWDADSPTMTALGPAAAMTDPAGNPRFETYGSATGVVVDPTDPRVQARIAQTAREFTEQVPVDFLFEDQVGARSWLPGAAGEERFGYSRGLLENARTVSRSLPVMTEGGWDRLAEFEIAFIGNGRLSWEQPSLPSGTWRPFPLMTIMANENTASYPHNLAGEVMAHTAYDMLYMVALGSNLGYDLHRVADGWMGPCAAIQRRVLSRTFGQRITDFQDQRPANGTTFMTFANGDVIFGNWNQTAVDWRGHRVAALGFATQTADGSLLSGWFEGLDGTDLPGDKTLLIRENGQVEVLLGEALGASTGNAIMAR